MRQLLSVLLLLPIFGLACSPASAQQPRQNNSWYTTSNSDTVFIFVHGIFSNSADCWLSPSGAYWPEILKNDPRFKGPGIFLGGYYTDFSSGLYKISDAADELLTHLRLQDTYGNSPPLEKKNIIFIGHSTGGLVVRYLLERNQELFKDKAVGIVLLASPSRGSAWANRLEWLRKIFGNKMASQLARDNDFITDLDLRFADLVSQKKIPNLAGVDLFENKFIVRGLLFSSEKVVSATDSASYFGAYKIIPDSDHFSVAKPRSASDAPNQMLLDFYENRFRSLPVQPAEATLKQPRFAEEVDKIIVTVGGNSFIQSIEKLRKEPHYPINMNGIQPIKFYIDAGVPYADMLLYNGPEKPIELKHNRLINKPLNWDINSNQSAMEIVNKDNTPLYQLYYKTDHQIVINGIFPFPGGVLLAKEDGLTINPILPFKFQLKRIFKYPSWKYPGEYDESTR